MKPNNQLYPHPVMGQTDDIEGVCEFKEDPEIIKQEESFNIKFEIHHNNGTIDDYVKYDKAIYACQVFCSGTLYRETFTSKVRKFEFKIPLSSLKNKVEFFVFGIAIKDISHYTNPAFHSDWDDFQFSLDKGDILAYFGNFEFNANIQYHRLRAAGSFMQIISSEIAKGVTEYVLDENKILIKLPKDSYDKFKLFGKNKDYVSLIHASLVQNALTVALYNFKEYLERDLTWARAIEYRLENEIDLNHGSSEIDIAMVPEIAQKLLGNPNDRLIDWIDETSNFQNHEE